MARPNDVVSSELVAALAAQDGVVVVGDGDSGGGHRQPGVASDVGAALTARLAPAHISAVLTTACLQALPAGVPLSQLPSIRPLVVPAAWSADAVAVAMDAAGVPVALVAHGGPSPAGGGPFAGVVFSADVHVSRRGRVGYRSSPRSGWASASCSRAESRQDVLTWTATGASARSAAEEGGAVQVAVDDSQDEAPEAATAASPAPPRRSMSIPKALGY